MLYGLCLKDSPSSEGVRYAEELTAADGICFVCVKSMRDARFAEDVAAFKCDEGMLDVCVGVLIGG